MSSSTLSAAPVLEPTAELVSFAERQVRYARLYRGDERRSELRRLMVIPALVQPVDGEYKAIGSPICGVTRDISPQGIGLFHSEPLNHNLLAIQITLVGEQINIITEKLWCRIYGPFYSIGGKFITKTDEFPS